MAHIRQRYHKYKKRRSTKYKYTHINQSNIQSLITLQNIESYIEQFILLFIQLTILVFSPLPPNFHIAANRSRSRKALKKLWHLGLQCLERDPDARPSLDDLLSETTTLKSSFNRTPFWKRLFKRLWTIGIHLTFGTFIFLGILIAINKDNQKQKTHTKHLGPLFCVVGRLYLL